ncbi:MAG: WxcM-like domain-containing protein [Pedobacter sp.]|nr:WxcM-like domain-containing protein [Pedobacter sp.]
MYDFTPDAILLVLASTAFDPKDYIYEPYDTL